jgi:hypothetical protein
MSRLLWRDAQGVEGALELDGRELVIGRAMECAIRTEDAMVSRHHARVVYVGGQFYVEDLGSSNGVFFQEQRVVRHALRHGDAVRCGSLWLRFVDSSHHRGESGYGGGSAAAGGGGDRGGSGRGERSHASTGPPVASYQAQSPPVFPAQATPQAIPPDQTPGPFGAGGDPEEVPRLRRRVEQLQAELRIYRGGGEGATRYEQLEEEIARVVEERDRLKRQVADMHARFASEGGDVKVQRAGAIAQTAAEIVSGLNDVLSNLRINVMAAEGEFGQYSSVIPRASFELIREALRSSATDMESARELLRRLRALAI